MTNAKRCRLVACTVLLLFFAVPNIFGQEGTARVTVFGGGSFLKGERLFNVGGDSFRTNFANGGKIGMRGTVDLDDHWAVEGAYSYGRNNLRISELAGSLPRTRAFGVRVHQFTGNALYFLSGAASKIRPFATAGIGLSRFSPTSDAKAAATRDFVDNPATISSDNKLSFNFGGGVEAKTTDWLGARLDFRDHISRIPRFGVPQSPQAGIADFFPVNGAVHDIEASLGIVIYLKR